MRIRDPLHVAPDFVLPGNGPVDLIRLPEIVRRTKSSCLKWSTGPFQAARNGLTLPDFVLPGNGTGPFQAARNGPTLPVWSVRQTTLGSLFLSEIKE